MDAINEGKFSRAAAGALVGLGTLFSTPALGQPPSTPTQKEQSPEEFGAYPVNILARTLWAEGRGDFEKDPRALYAIATVIWNRTAKKYGEDQIKKNPMTLVMTVLSPRQFSCWNEWTSNHPTELPPMKDRGGNGWALSRKIAEDMVNGQFEPLAEVGDASHYFNPNLVIPYWSKEMVRVVKIGNHLFVKPEFI